MDRQTSEQTDTLHIWTRRQTGRWLHGARQEDRDAFCSAFGGCCRDGDDGMDDMRDDDVRRGGCSAVLGVPSKSTRMKNGGGG